MDERSFGRPNETDYHRQRPPGRYSSRPDRIALWAVLLVVTGMIAAAASAHGANGGTDASGSGECAKGHFGERDLRMGDCGSDVRTLNWVLKAKRYSVPLRSEFEDPTEASVRRFQERNELGADGIVGNSTRRTLVRSMRRDVATWYGPGFFGNETACGETLTRRTVGIAHRRLPCGTRVVVGYEGRWLRTRVIDRGPFDRDARWDLTQKAARKLGFTVTDKIRVQAIK